MRKYIIMASRAASTHAKLWPNTSIWNTSASATSSAGTSSTTKLGAQVRRSVAAGELVDDDLVGSVVHRRLSEHDWNYGFIIDGFPRNQPQARFFLESYDLDAVILLEVPDQLVKEAHSQPAPVLGVRGGLQPHLASAGRGRPSATCVEAGWWPGTMTPHRRSRAACGTTTRPGRS